jgi:hypothetical protein
MSTFEQVLELIQTLTAEEVAELRARLDERTAWQQDKAEQSHLTSIAPRQLGTLASRGKIHMSDDFDDYLGDDFWLGDKNG